MKPSRARSAAEARLPLPRANLVDAARVVFGDYEDLLGGFPEVDAEVLKAFTGRHTASRVGLAHFEHLLKLAAAVGDPDQVDDAAVLVDAARVRIAATEEAAADAADFP